MPIITHSRPSPGSFPMWFGTRAVVKPLLQSWPLRPSTMKPLLLVDRGLAIGHKVGGVTSTPVTLGGRRADYIVPRGPSARDSDTVILYLHGGAFLVCGLASHRSVASRLGRATGTPVFSLAYRQLPEAGVGTSVHDAYDAYRELISERGYRRVVLAGDSAGGFLSPKIVELAAQDGLPAPAAFVGFSPLLDLDLASNPDRRSRSDAYLPIAQMARLAPMFDQGPIPLRGTRRIPDLPGELFPPTLLVSAQNEMLEPDMIELVENIDAAGGEATLHRFRWQVHAFPAITAQHPESAAAVSLAADFIGRVFRSASSEFDDETAVHGTAG